MKELAYNKKYEKLSKTQGNINALKDELKIGELYLLEKEHKK